MTRRALGRALGAATLALAVAPAIAAGAAAPGAGPAAFRVPPPQRATLKNGLTVLVLERRSVPLVQLRLMIDAGAVLDPPGKEGAAALTARLLKRGTASRPARQFAEEVEFVGGLLEADAGVESTVVVGEFASRDLEVGLNLMSDMVVRPLFPQAEFDNQKSLALADIVARLDDPSRLAAEAFDAWLYGDHPYGRPAEGTSRSVSSLTRADVESFHRAFYAPNAAILAVVGDVDAAQAMARVESRFSGWQRARAPRPRLADPPAARGRRILLLDKPDATQSQIRFGNVGLARNHPDRVPLTVANTILGGGFTSWLVDEVRVKRGLTYGIRSSIVARRAAGSFVVSTFSKNETVVETIAVSLEQVGRLRAGSIPAEDLDKARNYLSGLYPLQIESPDDLAEEILNVEFYGLGRDYINQYRARVGAVGMQEVRKAAARHVPHDDLAIVVVGPAAQLEKPLAKLGRVTVRPAAPAPAGPAGGQGAPGRAALSPGPASPAPAP